VGHSGERATAAAGSVLLTLASAQFFMTLDSSVMNVSIATGAKDVGTTVTGIQTAITCYTLVMASLMVTGGKLGQIPRPQAFLRHRVHWLRVRIDGPRWSCPRSSRWWRRTLAVISVRGPACRAYLPSTSRLCLPSFR
jgi:hypothetical protein